MILEEISWDTLALGMKCYEIKDYKEDVLSKLFSHAPNPGHYTVRVSPSASKKLLHQFGFYYCDTLADVTCFKNDFIFFDYPDIQIQKAVSVNKLLSILEDAFQFDRFHRDFNVTQKHANLRYQNWLLEMHKENWVYELIFQNECAGFICCIDNRILLQALNKKFRQKKLSKYFWSQMCLKLFQQEHKEITSSISMSNLAAVNLFISLGFKIKNAVDIYHRFIP